MFALNRTVLRLRSRLAHELYVQRERRLATVGANERALSILFAPREAWEPFLREGFAGLPHRLHFEDLRTADLERHDLIVPLSLDDARLLRRQPPHVRDRMLPLPDDQCTALCHDKPRLNRFLSEGGFRMHIPVMRDDLLPPYVVKPANGENSDDCLLINHGSDEVRWSAELSRPGMFRQAAVPGAVEHATHFVMHDGELKRELTVHYHHDSALFIKSVSCPSTLARRLGRCPDIATLTAMLRAIGYEGVGCANYKMRRGRLQLLEINPRLGGSLCTYFFSFLRSMPSTHRTRRTGCTNWTWLDSIVERDSAVGT